MDKIFIFTQDDGWFDSDENFCSDKHVANVLSGSNKFKIEQLKKEYEEIHKAIWKAKTKPERRLCSFRAYMQSMMAKDNFLGWLRREKNFKEVYAFEEFTLQSEYFMDDKERILRLREALEVCLPWLHECEEVDEMGLPEINPPLRNSIKLCETVLKETR